MQKKTYIKTAKSRTASSTKWLYRHINDPYVSMAQQQGYRSRAAFKLIEINQKYKIIPSNGIVIDLGCAPGSWLQVFDKKNIKTFGIDLKEVQCNDMSNNIETIVGDFSDECTIKHLMQKIDCNKITLVASDMAPNSCGEKNTDHIRIIYLAEQVLSFIQIYCVAHTNAIIKLIQGGNSTNLHLNAKKMFKKVDWYKPKSSYSDSAEIYLIMLNKL